MYIFKYQSILQPSLEVQQQLPNLHQILKTNDKLTLQSKSDKHNSKNKGMNKNKRMASKIDSQLQSKRQNQSF